MHSVQSTVQYNCILKNRLEKEEKGMIPETQAGFRRGKSTIDNMFVIMHIIEGRKQERRR